MRVGPEKPSGRVDPLLARIRALGIPAAQIHPTARWLVTEGRHRDPVKIGIALLGFGHDREERAVLKTLAGTRSSRSTSQSS